jgi:pimeloyl-ACP methyl ester carboxylesterase
MGSRSTRGLSRRVFIKLAAAGLPIASGARAGAREIERRGWARGAGSERAPFVFVHGAWHGAWCWYKIVAGLESSGRRATAIDLPGGGIDSTPPNDVTRALQVERVVGVLDAIAEPVILVGHSAGGPVVSEAAEARPDWIEKLVYLSAFLVPDGVSPTEIAIGDADSLLPANLIIVPAEGSLDVRPEGRHEVFYNECRRRDLALADTLFKPASLQALVPPMRLGAAFESVRRFYITCLRDHAISPAAQESMYTTLPCEEVLTIATSDHSPFFSRPQQLLRALLAIERT